MAKSNLLKEAIADAKAVRETAIANAKIALEEAFTPRLQSILSQKIQTELEEEQELDEEYGSEDTSTAGSSEIGAGSSADSGTNNKQPSAKTNDSHTELGDTDKETSAVGSELDDNTVVKEGEDEDEDGVIDDPTGASVTEDEDFDADDIAGDETEETDDDELDLESIIRELESEFGDDDTEEAEEELDGESEEEFGDEEETEFEDEAGEEELDTDDAVGDEVDIPVDDEEDVDLDEILREMGYGDDEDEEEAEEAPTSDEFAEKEQELEEAYGVIKKLQGTINEVNLLNAKLLYSNKLFRNYDLTNEQKMKVVETLDRTVSVREVKLVFATLAESMKIGGTTKRKQKTKITESFSSNPTKSTAPKKEIISEGNAMAERFKHLANIK